MIHNYQKFKFLFTPFFKRPVDQIDQVDQVDQLDQVDQVYIG